jgi:hypothetical protein
MKKINSPEPVVIEEQTVSNTQNTTFTNLSLTASSNQITEFNSDSLSPGESKNPPQPLNVRPPTKPKKIFPRKPIKKVLKVPKALPVPRATPVINENVFSNEKPESSEMPMPNMPPPMEFNSQVPKPVKKKFNKKKNKFKGNRFVAFDINKL